MSKRSEDDFGYSMIESQMNEAKFHINQAIRFLIRAADVADNFGKAKPLDVLIDKLEDDFIFEMEQVITKYKKEG